MIKDYSGEAYMFYTTAPSSSKQHCHCLGFLDTIAQQNLDGVFF